MVCGVGGGGPSLLWRSLFRGGGWGVGREGKGREGKGRDGGTERRGKNEGAKEEGEEETYRERRCDLWLWLLGLRGVTFHL